VHNNGKKELGSCLETLPLTEAYARFLADKQTSTKKRKLDADQNPTPPSTTTRSTAQPQSSHAPADEQQPAPPPPPPKSEDPQYTESPPKPKDPPHTPPLPTEKPSPPPPPAPTGPTTPTLHFYLLRPHTPSSSHVLIPLPRTTTLSSCLQHRVILEFPTIYTLPHAPRSLPGGFILESEFLGHSKEEAEEIEELLSTVRTPLGPAYGEHEAEDARTRGAQAGLDDRKILDVLRKDLGGAVGLV